jgi:hypothetical protein
MIANDEYIDILKEAALVCFKILFHSFGETGKL